MKHLIKTMMDELKDAKMMYDYACDAKKDCRDDLAMFYIQRAEQRLKMLEEDHALAQKEVMKLEKEGQYAKEGKWDCLHEFYIEEKQELIAKVRAFQAK